MLNRSNRLPPLRTAVCASVLAAFLMGTFTHAAGFELKVTERNIPRGPRYTLCLITTEANKFSFQLPKEFKVRADAATQTIVLYKLDNSCAVHLRFNEETGPTQNTHDTLRPRVFASHPEAEIVEEFMTSAAGRECPAFELKKHSNGYGIVSRAIFVAFPNAEVELTLVAPIRRGENLDNCYSLLNDVGSSLWQGAPDSDWNFGTGKERVE